MIAGIRWLSIGPGTGYGNASESYLRGLRRTGVPVTWTPIGWPSSTWDSPLGPVTDFTWHKLDRAAHLDIANRAIEHDVVVVHSTPLWHDQLAVEADGRPLVAYTTWETDRLPADSVAVLDRYDGVLVPSRFNATVFKSSGVTAPLGVVPHIARAPRWRVPATGTADTLIFYLIATWTARKAILDVVSAYLTAFTTADDVLLVIHTTPDDLIARARAARCGRPAEHHETATWFTLAKTLARRTNVPEITLSTRWLTEACGLGSGRVRRGAWASAGGAARQSRLSGTRTRGIMSAPRGRERCLPSDRRRNQALPMPPCSEMPGWCSQTSASDAVELTEPSAPPRRVLRAAAQ